MTSLTSPMVHRTPSDTSSENLVTSNAPDRGRDSLFSLPHVQGPVSHDHQRFLGARLREAAARQAGGAKDQELQEFAICQNGGALAEKPVAFEAMCLPLWVFNS